MEDQEQVVKDPPEASPSKRHKDAGLGAHKNVVSGSIIESMLMDTLSVVLTCFGDWSERQRSVLNLRTLSNS